MSFVLGHAGLKAQRALTGTKTHPFGYEFVIVGEDFSFCFLFFQFLFLLFIIHKYMHSNYVVLILDVILVLAFSLLLNTTN